MPEQLPTLPQIHVQATCGCGDADAHDDPVIDAMAIPHAIRHGAVLGALGSLPPGGAMVLVAAHDPLPLLAQARARHPEGLGVEYLQRGPDAWRIRLQRV